VPEKLVFDNDSSVVASRSGSIAHDQARVSCPTGTSVISRACRSECRENHPWSDEVARAPRTHHRQSKPGTIQASMVGSKLAAKRCDVLESQR